MMFIGDKEIIFTTSFLIGNFERPKIKLTVDGEPLQISLNIVSSIGSKRTQWDWENDKINITFHGWGHDGPIATPFPLKIGEINNKNIGFQACSNQINHLTYLTFWLLLGGKYA